MATGQTGETYSDATQLDGLFAAGAAIVQTGAVTLPDQLDATGNFSADPTEAEVVALANVVNQILAALKGEAQTTVTS